MKNDEKIIFSFQPKIDDAEKLVEIYAPYVKNTNITFEYEVPIIDEFKQRITKIMSKFPYILAVLVMKQQVIHMLLLLGNDKLIIGVQKLLFILMKNIKVEKQEKFYIRNQKRF